VAELDRSWESVLFDVALDPHAPDVIAGHDIGSGQKFGWFFG
jgi:hypothetical protein